MSTIAERILDRLFEKRVIVNCARDPYLHRWYVIRTKRVGLFIHKFVRSDEDRALHDHPWSFIVIPLWGGYIEHSDRPVDYAARGPIPAPLTTHGLAKFWHDHGRPDCLGAEICVAMSSGRKAIFRLTYKERAEGLDWSWYTFSFVRYEDQLARVPVKRRVWPIISARYRNTEYRHRVELIDDRPSWSLFIRFKKIREWGFWLPSGFQLWNKWWQDKCE